MSLTHAQAFAQFRAVLQTKGTPSDWGAFQRLFYEHIQPNWQNWRLSDPKRRKLNRAFLESYGEYIESSLEAWPEASRTISLNNDSPEMHAFGRVATYFSHTQSKRELTAQFKAFKSSTFKDFIGFQTQDMSRYGDYALDLLLNLMPEDLSHLFFTYSSSGSYKTGKMDASIMRRSLSYILETYASTITSLGTGVMSSGWGGAMDKEQGDAIWETVLEHGPKLTNLKELYMLHPPHGTKEWEVELLHSEHFDTLEAFALGYGHEDDISPKWSALITRQASQNLRRLMLQPVTEEEAISLLTEPNLANVEQWDLKTDRFTRIYPSWTQDNMDYWGHKASELKGDETGVHPLLMKKHLGAHQMSEEEFMDVLVSDEGNLRPSLYVESISLAASSSLSRTQGEQQQRFTRLLFDQGAAAYPNLREVTLYALLSPELQRHLADSPLFEQLDEVSWSYPIFLGEERNKGEDLMRDLIEIVRDDTLPKRCRWAAWQTFIHPTYDRYAIPGLKARAKFLGLRGYSKLRLGEYREFLCKALPEDMPAKEQPKPLDWGVGWQTPPDS